MDRERVLYLCGMKIPPMIISSPHSRLEVVFQSDMIFESTGFQAVYAVTGKTFILFRRGNTTLQEMPCGFLLSREMWYRKSVLPSTGDG